MSKLDEMYKLKFKAEEEGGQEKAEFIENKIREYLAGKDIDIDEIKNYEKEKEEKITENKKEEAKMKFFYKTRKKAFHKNLREQIEKEKVDDIELALAMNSMLTHALIEMKKEGEGVYHKLDVYTLTETVSKFLSGELSTKEVVDVINEYYTDYLTSRLDRDKLD